MKPLRLVFMGSPEFSVPVLAALMDAGHDIVCVYSQPPRPAGRGQKVRPSSVHAFALEKGLPVRTPESFKGAEEQEAFQDLFKDPSNDGGAEAPVAAVVVAYGLILPKAVIEAPGLGCLNVHASLLPRWRGAAPMQHAIMAGDAETGVTIMKIEQELDSGAILKAGKVPITADTTAETLHDTLAGMGGPLMLDALEGLAAGTLEPEPQGDDGVTYAPKLGRDEGRLDWSLSAAELERRVRALNPRPGVWFEHAGDRIKVLAADVAEGESGHEPGTPAPGTLVDDALGVACGSGVLRLKRVQRAGRDVQDAGAFLLGFPLAAGINLVNCA